MATGAGVGSPVVEPRIDESDLQCSRLLGRHAEVEPVRTIATATQAVIAWDLAAAIGIEDAETPGVVPVALPAAGCR